jgi:hypothetical protein
MQVELQRFAEAFKSEEELRRHVATLLGKLGDNINIEITHGSQEYGKDIVFYSRDAIGDWVLNACVIKNAKIMGSADDKGARNVLIQVEQALDTPFLKSSGESESVSRVYVISPYDCSQSTMHSIQGKLKERSGQVTFLCGSRLLEKFVQSWPEFLVFESTLLGAYVAALQKRLGQDDPIGFLMSHHEFISAGKKTLSNVYVRQGFLKTFTTVTLLVDSPHFASLRRALPENRLNEIVESLVFVSNLLVHAQAWETGNYAVAKKYSAQLKEFARSLSESWKTRYDVFRTTCLERGRAASSIKKAHIRSRGFNWSQLEELEHAVVNAIENLAARVARANDFAQSRPKMLDVLHSKDHLNYCRIHEVVHAFPQGFRIDRVSRYDVQLPDDLLEQATGSVLITAPAGLGKTSFCKWNTLSDVSRLTQRVSETIPIYVALHQLSTAAITNYSEVFLRTAEIQDLFEDSKKNGRHVRVYLDGPR